MSRRRGPGPEPEGITAVYEGPEVLAALLSQAGAAMGVEEVVAAFTRAQAAGEPRSAIIPTLFTAEPRFASSEEALRLYGNLFGLWGRLAAGRGAHDDAPEVAGAGEELAPLPERGSEPGDVLPAELVEAVWKALASVPPRELQRRKDRFASAQPDLVAWLESTPLPAVGVVAVQDLAFESWAMFDQAFGDRLGTVDFRDLRALETEPPPLAELQPALAAYAVEQLEVLAEEEAGFDAAARAQVERAVAAVGAALSGAVVLPS